MIEVSDRWVRASQWRRPDGVPSPLTEIPVLDEEFSPLDGFDDLEPDEQHFHEATGDEGASFERTYSRAALVLWPRGHILAVINQVGLRATHFPFLGDLAGRWAASGEDHGSLLWREAHDLSGHVLSTWPGKEWYPREGTAVSEVAQFLVLLTRLEDRERVEMFLADIAARRSFDVGDSPAILGALGLLPADLAAFLLQRIIAGGAVRSLAACADLPARAAGRLSDADLSGAARALVEALPSDRRAPRDVTERARRGTGLRVDLVTAPGAHQRGAH